MSLRERIKRHQDAIHRVSSLVEDAGAELSILGEIAVAIHEYAVTAFELEMWRTGDLTAEMKTHYDNLAIVEREIDRYQDVIERAQRGQSPWGEILAVGEQLKAAVRKMRGES